VKETRGPILIIEDDQETRNVLCQLLADDGYLACTAERAEVGIELLGRMQPSVILLDRHLPGMGSAAFVRWLKEHSELDHVPLIMVTGDGDRPAESRVLGFLRKPFNVDHLLSIVSCYCERTSQPPGPLTKS